MAQQPLLSGTAEEPKSAAAIQKSKSSQVPQPNPPSKVPQILFEGDEPSRPSEAAPAQKFELGSAHSPQSSKNEDARLPEAYGTGKLFLTARDPHTLFAHWDLTSEQQRRYNSLSEDGHLTLRAYAHAFSNQPAAEIRLEPDSRHVFLQVQRTGASYVGELGYYQPEHHWKTIATSGPTTVPFDAPSEDTTVTFATLPPMGRIVQAGVLSRRSDITETPPADLLQSIIPVPVPRWPLGLEENEEQQLARTEAAPLQSQSVPADAPAFVKRRKQWTSAREKLLAEMIRTSMERRQWINSAEIAELVRGEFELPEQFALSEVAWPLLPGALVDISSPAGEAQPMPQGFWFNVNAELIIYGATEPNAQVAIGGRPIKLRPDGSFSCHFALPDGDYHLIAVALSPQNEMRQAAINFRRHTEYSADTGVHAQNPSLQRIPQAQ